VVWGIQGWTEQSVSSSWRWIQPMVGAMVWPFLSLLLSRSHARA